MSKKDHTSDEFGKRMSANAGNHYFDRPGAHNIGAPAQIRLTGIDAEKSGKTESPFTIATWKIVLTLAIVFAIGVVGVWFVAYSGFVRPPQDTSPLIGSQGR